MNLNKTKNLLDTNRTGRIRHDPIIIFEDNVTSVHIISDISIAFPSIFKGSSDRHIKDVSHANIIYEDAKVRVNTDTCKTDGVEALTTVIS